ncbi:MAG: signal peptidase I [Planctomycetes bacterium]|nr:signal peptidase I [Planctomycetota bacterium]
MSGIVTSGLWKKLDMRKRICVDIAGLAIMFIISLILLSMFNHDSSGTSINNWAYSVLLISVVYLLLVVCSLFLLLRFKRKILPILLIMLYVGHILAVLAVLFFSVDGLTSIDLGLGGGVTMGIFGILLIISIRDLLGDIREAKFWQLFYSDLKEQKQSGNLSVFWKIVLFIWQPQYTKDETTNPIRDFAEGILMAFILALIIRTFSLEAYKIPTGSMKPTLWGESLNHDGMLVKEGDKILVNKLVYSLRKPERFEIIVFKYPLNSIKNFIKRCVGMPEEEMLIYQGDIWRRPAIFDEKSGKWVGDENAEFKIVKKSLREQNSLWNLYYSYKFAGSINNQGKGVKCDIFPLKLGIPRNNDWTPTTLDHEPTYRTHQERNRDYVDWEYDNKSAWKTVEIGKDIVFEADVTDKNPSALGFAKFIKDRFALPRSNREYETYSFRDKQEIEQNDRSFPAFSPVADIKFRSIWRFSKDASAKIQFHRAFGTDNISNSDLWIELTLGTEKTELAARVLSEDSAVRTIKYPGDFSELLKKHDILIKPDRDVIVDFAYVDGDVIIEINNKHILRWQLKLPFTLPLSVAGIEPHDEVPETAYFRMIALEGKVSFKHPEFWRDIYYRTDGVCNPTVIIPAEKYFALGDNCTNSKDSRLWYIGVFKVKLDDGTIIELKSEMDPGGESKNEPQIDLLRMSNLDDADFTSENFRYELDELRSNHKIVRIEDVFGVVHNVPTQNIQSFEIKKAPFVPYKNLLGKAMIRFWPLLGMKFAR